VLHILERESKIMSSVCSDSYFCRKTDSASEIVQEKDLCIRLYEYICIVIACFSSIYSYRETDLISTTKRK